MKFDPETRILSAFPHAISQEGDHPLKVVAKSDLKTLTFYPVVSVSGDDVPAFEDHVD